MARPSKYKPEFAEQARKLCFLGATDRELADFFKVSQRTLNLWKVEYPEFLQSLKLGKEAADERVVSSLYNRALGYSHNAIKIHVSKDGDVTKVPYVEHVPPDVTACIFWLKNRDQANWRDKLDLDVNTKPTDVTSEPLPAKDWDEQYGSGPQLNG